MKAPLQHSLLILTITVIAILARPCFVFASQSINSPRDNQRNTADLRQVIRKRNEYIYTQDEAIVLDDTRRKIDLPSFNSLSNFLRRLQLRLLLYRSNVTSTSASLFKEGSTVFQISPHNDCYLGISVFRI
ncbi:MAG: hypothetical protein ACXVBX_05465 [Flavisolibacter sp.]